MMEFQSASVHTAIPGTEPISRPVSANSPRRGTQPRTTAKPRPEKAAQPRRPHRPATRTPDMSHPTSRSVKPTVVLGGVPRVEEAPKKRAFALSADAPRVRTIRAQKHAPFPFATLFLLLICTGLFMYMVHNFVEINEYSMQIDNMKEQLEELEGKQQILELELENRNDMSVIAGIAEKDLGMVKMDEVDKVYLDGSGEDKIEISKSPEDEGTEVDVLSVLLNAIVQNFRDFAEYID